MFSAKERCCRLPIQKVSGLDLERVWKLVLFLEIPGRWWCCLWWWWYPSSEVDFQCKKLCFQWNSNEIYVGKPWPLKSSGLLQLFFVTVREISLWQSVKSHSTRSCPLLGITSLCTELTVLMSRGQNSEVHCCRKMLKFTNGGYFYFSSKLCMSYTAVY